MNSSTFAKQVQIWQRLSPLSVMFFVGKIVGRILKDALPSMAPLAVIIFSSDNKAWITSSIVVGIIALVIIGSVLQYWFFKFKQQDYKILINDGVFKKNHRVIQFDRIQNINIVQPLYFRPFNLVTLQIETAGSKGNEADLAGIPRDFAEYLRNQVLQQQESMDANLSEDENGSLALDQDKIIVQASLADLVKYGVSSNGIFWFFIFLAPLIGLSDDFLEKWVTKEDFSHVAEFLGGGIMGNTIIIFSIFLMVIVLMFGFSILGAILRYFNYRLTLRNQTRTAQTLKRSSGLITNYEESLKTQKIQTLIFQSNFIGRWLKIINLTLGQISSSQVKAKNKQSLFIVPARSKKESLDIQKIVFDDSPDEIQTKGIDRRYINKTIAIKIFLPSLIASLYFYLSNGNILILGLPFLLSLVMLPLVIKRWKSYRFGMKNGYGKFERGLFGFRHILFPLYKVQRTEVRQSPIQRRRNLATLKIYLASNQIQMQYIPIDEANRWMEVIGREIENTDLAWY